MEEVGESTLMGAFESDEAREEWEWESRPHARTSDCDGSGGAQTGKPGTRQRRGEPERRWEHLIGQATRWERREGAPLPSIVERAVLACT